MDHREINQFHVAFIFEVLKEHFGIINPKCNPERSLVNAYFVHPHKLAAKLAQYDPVFEKTIVNPCDSINDIAYNNRHKIEGYLHIRAEHQAHSIKKTKIRLYNLMVWNVFACAMSILIPSVGLITREMIFNSLPICFWVAAVMFGINAWNFSKIAKKRIPW